MRFSGNFALSLPPQEELSVWTGTLRSRQTALHVGGHHRFAAVAPDLFISGRKLWPDLSS